MLTPRRALALIAALLTLTFLLPPGRTSAKALAVSAESLGLRLPRPFASYHQREVRFGSVVGDLYAPARGGSPVVLLPGAAPRGRDDPRLVRVAQALARAGRLVIVPELALYDERLVEEDVERIVTVVREASARTGGEPVVVVGISYGGALSLLAVADPAIRDEVATVAVFGAYTELVGVIQAVTTGVSLVEGRAIEWRPHPDADEVLRDRIVELLPPEERGPLERALTGRLDPARLEGGARVLYELLDNDDPRRTREIAAELPTRMRERLAALSPSSRLDEVEADILAMHAVDDPLVPYAEALRLRAARPDADLRTLRWFGHVDLEASSPRDWLLAVGDLWHVWRFTTGVLAPHEGLLPGR